MFISLAAEIHQGISLHVSRSTAVAVLVHYFRNGNLKATYEADVSMSRVPFVHLQRTVLLEPIEAHQFTAAFRNDASVCIAQLYTI